MSRLRTFLGRVRRVALRQFRAVFPPEPLVVSRLTIDFNDRAIACDPFPHYETLRLAGSVQFVTRHDAWVVFGYDDVQAALAQPNVFSNAAYAEVDRVLLAADPPDHTAMRKVVSRLFTAEAVNELDAFAASAAETRLFGRVDAVLYGQWLSEAVTAQVLGFSSAVLDHVRTAMVSVREERARIVFLREVSGQAALLQRLCGSGIDETAARSLATLIWLAGTTTTQRVIAEAVLALLLRPDLRQMLSDDHSRIPAFVDEVLRRAPAELMVPRVTTQPVTLGGVDIPAGALVHLCVAAANRDPARFEDPAALRLERSAPRHMTFGYGAHHCVGAMLARRVIATSIRALLIHAPAFRAVEPLGELTRTARITVHTLDRLLIDTHRA